MECGQIISWVSANYSRKSTIEILITSFVRGLYIKLFRFKNAYDASSTAVLYVSETNCLRLFVVFDPSSSLTP